MSIYETVLTAEQVVLRYAGTAKAKYVLVISLSEGYGIVLKVSEAANVGARHSQEVNVDGIGRRGENEEERDRGESTSDSLALRH